MGILMADSRRSVFVTGAAGFIGGRLVECLHFLGRDRVRAGIRSWSSSARIARLPVAKVPCDVMLKQQVHHALDESMIVVHCALGSKETIIDGTRNVLDVALQHQVERVIYLSSVEVYGNVQGEVQETSPYQYAVSEYGDSKIEAEKLCWAYSERGLPVTILRPTVVYGPFSKLWTVALAERLQSGKWGTLSGHGEGKCNLLYVDDLVNAISLAIDCPSAVGHAFNISGPEVTTWNQYFQRLNTAIGLPELPEMSRTDPRISSTAMQPIRGIAKYLLHHFGDSIMKVYERFHIAKRMMKFAEESIRMTPTPAELAIYSRDAIYTTTKARNVFGYVPATTVDFGLQMTVLWLQHHRLICSPKVEEESDSCG